MGYSLVLLLVGPFYTPLDLLSILVSKSKTKETETETEKVRERRKCGQVSYALE